GVTTNHLPQINSSGAQRWNGHCPSKSNMTGGTASRAYLLASHQLNSDPANQRLCILVLKPMRLELTYFPWNAMTGFQSAPGGCAACDCARADLSGSRPRADGRPNTITVAEKCASARDDRFAFVEAIAYFYVASLRETHGDLPRFDLFVANDLDNGTST